MFCFALKNKRASHCIAISWINHVAAWCDNPVISYWHLKDMQPILWSFCQSDGRRRSFRARSERSPRSSDRGESRSQRIYLDTLEGSSKTADWACFCYISGSKLPKGNRCGTCSIWVSCENLLWLHASRIDVSTGVDRESECQAGSFLKVADLFIFQKSSNYNQSAKWGGNMVTIMSQSKR